MHVHVYHHMDLLKKIFVYAHKTAIVPTETLAVILSHTAYSLNSIYGFANMLIFNSMSLVSALFHSMRQMYSRNIVTVCVDPYLSPLKYTTV
jgi:hypothetical protein